jgi:hypothetical protein
MDRKRIVLAILTSACLATSMLVGTIPSNAQINGFGTSTSGGSGGAPTGPSNFTGIYGSSSAGGSGGLATGPTNFGTQGFGLSTAGGSGGRKSGGLKFLVIVAVRFVSNPVERHALAPASWFRC